MVLFFNGEVGKLSSILPTLHTSLEQHDICIQCGPSWEGGGKRRWLQFFCSLTTLSVVEI